MHAGRLARLVPVWVDERDLRILYPSNRYLSPRVRNFVDAVVRDDRSRRA